MGFEIGVIMENTLSLAIEDGSIDDAEWEKEESSVKWRCTTWKKLKEK